MLKKFEVQGFKNFENKFTLDLSKAHNYDFNKEMVEDSTVKVCSIFGKNSSGKSNLGLALLDAINHLTDDREKTSIDANPYLNLNRNDFAEFTYYFSFGKDELIYNYRKAAAEEMLYERIDINGKSMLEYNYLLSRGYCNLKGTENLKVDLKGRGLSLTKYVRNNSILDDNEENGVFKKFYNYIENMLLFYSLNVNRYFGYKSGGESIESSIVKNGKLKDFEDFLCNLEIKIAEKDKDGIGEIVAKGPSIMLGYYENKEATKKVLKKGWFYTGDYGYIDNDGFLYVTGRKSDVIVLRNGKNIYPQELEFLINKINYVEESLIYAREKNVTDTLICAKIVYNKDLITKELGEKTEEEYKKEIWNNIKEINKELPAYKHIKEIVITEEPLDKTTTHKVKRYQEINKLEKAK